MNSPDFDTLLANVITSVLLFSILQLPVVTTALFASFSSTVVFSLAKAISLLKVICTSLSDVTVTFGVTLVA